MTLPVTLADIRADVRTAANLRGGGASPTAAEIDRYINRSIRKIWHDIVRLDDGFAAASSTVATVANNEAITLPTDHFATRGLFRPAAGGGDLLRVERMSEQNYRHHYPGPGSSEIEAPGVFWYRGSTQIILRPIPTGIETLRLVYATIPTALVADGDTFDSILSVVEPVIEYAAGLAQPAPERRNTHFARAEQLTELCITDMGRRFRGAERLRGTRRFHRIA